MKKKIIIPARYLKVTPQKKTKAIRDRSSGQFRGRRVSESGDNTKVRRLTRDYDYDKDGRVDYHRGNVFGRSKSVKVRASKNRKGTVRKLKRI